MASRITLPIFKHSIPYAPAAIFFHNILFYNETSWLHQIGTAFSLWVHRIVKKGGAL